MPAPSEPPLPAEWCTRFAAGAGVTACDPATRTVDALLKVGRWVYDYDAEAFRCSAEAQTMLGVDDAPCHRAAALLQHLLPADRTRLEQELAHIDQDGRSAQLDISVFTGSPQERFLRIFATPGPGAPKSRHAVGAVMDITEQHQTDRALRVNQQVLACAADLAKIGVWSVDLRTNQLSWSDEVFRIHELPVGEPPSLEEAVAFYPADARQPVEEGIAELKRSGHPWEFELPLTTAKGQTIWVRSLGDLEIESGEAVRLHGVIQDVTARRTAEDDLRARERRWFHALAGANDGVWDWDLRTNEVYFSLGWKLLLGYADDELDSNISEWDRRLHPEDRVQAERTIQNYLTGVTDTFHCEHRLLHRDGTWRTHLGRGKVVERDEAGQPTRFVGTQTDITEQDRLRRELVAAKEVAETAARAKSEFLAVMSHEIRTPLNAILGLAQVLRDASMPEELRECAQAIHTSGDLLLCVLNDTLDFAKLEVGKLALELDPFDLRERLCYAFDLQRGVAQLKSICLEFHCDDTIPTQLIGDAGRLQQIIHNLVGNALKFTENGSVVLQVLTVWQTPDRICMRFEIRDTGPGIPPDAVDRIFDSFAQVDASTTRRHGGTGLGLAICRELVERMGGVIGVDSELGHGSTFWFELEAGIPATTAQPAEAVDLPRRVRPGARVLVVEDNPVNQLVARKMLTKLDCQVDVAGNGREGFEMATALPYDVVFMDCHMPDMDGFEATEAIHRAQPDAAKRPPIIAMTANVLPEDRARCTEVGMDDFVAKPVRLADITDAMIRVGVPTA